MGRLCHDVISGFSDLTHAFLSNHLGIGLSGELKPHHNLLRLRACLSFSRASIIRASPKPPKRQYQWAKEIPFPALRKDIQPGEEIKFTYYGQSECIRSHARNELLHFVCRCKACLPGTTFYEASEMRRQLLRGLYYLTMGLDKDHENPRTPSRIIIDPQLREAAKTLSIPLTSRFLYDTFIGLLLEEEGLAEPQMIQQIDSTMGYARVRLQLERNVKTVALALQQDTWPKKWQMASTIFGQPDSGDHYARSELQHMRSKGMF